MGDGILRQNRTGCSLDAQRSYCLTGRITNVFQPKKLALFQEAKKQIPRCARDDSKVQHLI
jgi:hypothetical protein